MNRQVLAARVAALITVSGMVAALASPVVIHDNGQTRPLPGSDPHIPAAPPPAVMPDGYDVTALFPVSTPSMTPGIGLAPLAAPAPDRLQRLPYPLFLVGSDPLSLHWLADRRDRLMALKAIGFVIEAATLADYQAVLTVAGPELIVVPGSAERLAELLGLRHYPVLLTREEVLP